MASSSSPRNWVYDVFPSFSGKDVRVTFMGHFLKELELKLITAFIDNDIERGQSLDPELKKAIKGSRIAVVVFSKNYASSTWCLNELGGGRAMQRKVWPNGDTGFLRVGSFTCEETNR